MVPPVGPRRLITAGALGGILLVGYLAASSAPVVSDERYGYVGNLTWLRNPEEAFARARNESKPVFMYFWAVWCQYCKKLDSEVWPDPRVKPVLQNDFVLNFIDIDVDKRTTRRMGVLYPPTLIFFKPDGTVITRVNGYVPAEDFLQIIEDVKRGVERVVSGNQTLSEPGTPP